MNAIELLKKDHQLVDELFNKLQGVPGKSADASLRGDREGLLSQLKYELDTHASIEENTFYPMFKDRPESRDLIATSLKQHAEIKRLLNEVCNLQPDSDAFMRKLTELRRDVQQHVNLEENDLFPKVQNLLSTAHLDDLGARLQQAKLVHGKKTRRPQSGPQAPKRKDIHTRPALH